MVRVGLKYMKGKEKKEVLLFSRMLYYVLKKEFNSYRLNVEFSFCLGERIF